MNKIKIFTLLFVLVFGLGLAFSANAALQAPGEVPVLDPVRPVDQNVGPNHSGNIQSGDAAVDNKDSADSSNDEVKDEAQNSAEPTPPAPSSSLPRTILVVVLILAAVAATGWYLYSKKIITFNSNSK